MDPTSHGFSLLGEKRRRSEVVGGLDAAPEQIDFKDLELSLLSGGIAMSTRGFSVGDANTSLSGLSTREKISGVGNSQNEAARAGCHSAFGGVDGCSFRHCESATKPTSTTTTICSKDSIIRSHNPPHCNASSSFSDKRVNDSLDLNKVSSSGLALNANAQHALVENNLNPFYPYKNFDTVKSKVGASECGSTTGPLKENESLKVWNAMKRNGFLSPSDSGVTVPKSQGPKRKNKTDASKKKFELAKREQANRFARIAAPSGILSGLNPGIINHVRNSKQVHAIIEALAKSGKQKICTQMKAEESITASDNTHVQESMRKKVGAFSSHTTSLPPLYGNKAEVVERELGKKNGRPSNGSKFSWDHHDKRLNLNLSLPSATGALQLTHNDSIDNLSVKGASVASQWLEFMYEDMIGRMAALRSSRKRVRLAIQREFPSMLSRHYALKVDNAAGIGNLPKATDLHILMWKDVFIRLDNTLSEEGNSLETSLEKIKEMLEHCKQGLLIKNPHNMADHNNEFKNGQSEVLVKECAIRAAAASFYSTCKFVTKPEDVFCIVPKIRN